MRYREANREKRREQSRAYHDANKDSVNARDRARRAADGGRTNTLAKARRKADGERMRARDKAWRDANKTRLKASWLKKKYGIDAAAFAKMIKSQRGRCAICRAPFGELKGSKPHVDHCHESGRIRGILCNGCNTGLGLFNESAATLKRAIRYLQAKVR
jgi:hypothetical protein